MMDFIERPAGCRHAQVAGTFAGTPLRQNTSLLALCQGGCDVCDMRVAALRNMAPVARLLLGPLLDAPGHTLPEAHLMQQVQVRRPTANLDTG